MYSSLWMIVFVSTCWSVRLRSLHVELACVFVLGPSPSCLFSQCAVVCARVCVCNEAKEKSFVMPSDSVAPSTRLKLPEHNREGLGWGEGVSMIDNDR